METEVIFSICNHHKCLIQVFPIHLNTYVMGLRPLEIFLLLQCGNRPKVYPRAVRINEIYWPSTDICTPSII